MKYIFIVVLGFFLISGTALATKEMISKGLQSGEITTRYTHVVVYKVIDGKTECFVAFSDYQANVSPNISCVK